MEIGQPGVTGDHVLVLVEEAQELDEEHAHPLHHRKRGKIASAEHFKDKVAFKKIALFLFVWTNGLSAHAETKLETAEDLTFGKIA